MLVLSRKLGEAITIGENGEIQLTIMGINGNQVRLGIKAEKNIPVHRQEIFQKIQAEKEAERQAGKTESSNKPTKKELYK